MSQRRSEYARRPRDEYNTPPWATQALLPHLRAPIGGVWEPACGTGQMAGVLLEAGYCVSTSDIHETGTDFLTLTGPADGQPVNSVVTNPPYGLAEQFITHALNLMQPVGGQVAMLLRTDYDHAASRAYLFRDCPAFAKKVILMRRIVWFVEDNGKPKASPSFNHAFYIWDWLNEGAPTLAYAP